MAAAGPVGARSGHECAVAGTGVWVTVGGIAVGKAVGVAISRLNPVAGPACQDCGLVTITTASPPMTAIIATGLRANSFVIGKWCMLNVNDGSCTPGGAGIVSRAYPAGPPPWKRPSVRSALLYILCQGDIAIEQFL